MLYFSILYEAGWPLRFSDRHRLDGYSGHRVSSLFLAGRSRNCLKHAVLKGVFPWRTRYPLKLGIH